MWRREPLTRHKRWRRDRGTAHPRPSAILAMRCVMKKLLLASVGLLAVGVASASAADIQRRSDAGEGAGYRAPPIYNWTGPYIGLQGGGGWGHSDFSARSRLVRYFGRPRRRHARLQLADQPMVVRSREVIIAWANIRGSSGCGVGSSPARPRILGSVPCARRLGSPYDRFMPYVTGGLRLWRPARHRDWSRQRADTKAGWTSAPASKPRSPDHGPPSSNISTSISDAVDSVARHQRKIQYEYRARRFELPLLIVR